MQEGKKEREEEMDSLAHDFAMEIMQKNKDALMNHFTDKLMKNPQEILGDTDEQDNKR
jgi:hypothetical protein